MILGRVISMQIPYFSSYLGNIIFIGYLKTRCNSQKLILDSYLSFYPMYFYLQYFYIAQKLGPPTETDFI